MRFWRKVETQARSPQDQNCHTTGTITDGRVGSPCIAYWISTLASLASWYRSFLIAGNVSNNIIQWSLHYQPKQCAITREILQNYHAFDGLIPKKKCVYIFCNFMTPPFLYMMIIHPHQPQGCLPSTFSASSCFDSCDEVSTQSLGPGQKPVESWERNPPKSSPVLGEWAPRTWWYVVNNHG